MDPLIIPIVGMLIPIIIVPTALGIKHARYLREIEHAERMRAMELGLPTAEEHANSPGSVAGSIGVGVPLGSLFLAFIAAPKVGPPETIEAIWMAATMVGVAGVICGSALAAMQLSKRGQPSAPPAFEKPSYDPDQFDVVGSRG
jgi:hypothetical protein